MTKATLADGTVVNMTYYANGLRASKQVGNATHKYYYDSNGNIIQIATQYASGSTANMVFTYDGTGVTGFVADGKYYYFVKNFFGDVTDLYCGTTHVAHYAYDSWGNHTVTDQYGEAISDQYAWANVNPFRYRGYFYDTDLGLYYLQSRYYDSNTGRFINADTIDHLDPKNINGLNLYAYCYSNPIKYVDPSGHSATAIIIALVVGAVVGGIVGAGVGVVKAKANGEDVTAAVISGIVSGAIMGAGAAVAGLYLAAAATGTVLISSVLTTTEASIMAGITAATSGFIGNALGEITYQKRKHGEIKDANAILEKAFIGAFNNTVAVFFWSMAEMSTIIQTITGSSLGNILSGVFEFIFDVLKNLGDK
ncbi:MAG: RHS repeat-associated core domain-containing protein [Clostridia bacterium]|nr:RHS repeat-associated core domain-containing protein [Clostridia bacterium]